MYCSHKGPWLPHPLDKTFYKYTCNSCITRYLKYKDNPKYILCDRCWGIYQKDKMEEDRNPFGTFYECKNHD